ncbi:F-box only protein 3 isoform X1 [Latimeria chalumnae]|uniref:F-box protein 3 n=1 Tax=Latimeria chalumnae TaxID=7897 RepID=H2ZU33_LATCH|nr:PREDICTED: F-box only protein 3 isoform X1 [Latimeria chalumnae]|eukprot:XP_006002058.1 PREDICTED: F-box only protein 3 isoform X1 [Latimeria chalumnae]
MAALQLVDLPADPLLLIFSFLDFPDFFSCSCVNRRFNQLSSHDPLWKRHCQKYWLVSDREKAQRNQSWKDIFRAFLSNDLGQYIEHYATLKQAWEDLKRFLGQTCPRMIGSLKAGATEAELDAVEARIGCKLPADYRCSFRIHNGQKLVVPGLMGSMALSNHYRSEDLLDIDTAAEGFQQRAGLKQCLPLTFCIHTGLSQYMALESVEGRERQEIFYQCQDQMAPNPSAIDMFLTGTSFTDWFTSYVRSVIMGTYPIIRDQVFRYVHDKKCVATTGDITVSVSTSFLPELSSIHPPHYFFTYRIRIEMSKDALPKKACQLDSRYWRITDANGDVENVQGPGVVGEFPILRPGNFYEYTSCTTFLTTSGCMEGHYTFHRLLNEEEVFNVTIPRFHMVCLPFRVSVVCKEGNHKGSVYEEDSTDTDDHEEVHRVLEFPVPGGHCPRHI